MSGESYMGILSKGIPVPVFPVSGGCSLGNEGHDDQSHDMGMSHDQAAGTGLTRHATTDSAPAQATQGKIPCLGENQTHTPPS